MNDAPESGGTPDVLSLDARLVKAATDEFHFDWHKGRKHGHGSFSDSVAHTHCICWGAAWRMLQLLRSLPVEQRMEAMGMLPLGHISDDGTTVEFTAEAWGCNAPLYMEACHAD